MRIIVVCSVPFGLMCGSGHTPNDERPRWWVHRERSAEGARKDEARMADAVLSTIPQERKRLTVLSLGAGVESTTVALMCAHGEITPMPPEPYPTVAELNPGYAETARQAAAEPGFPLVAAD